MQHALHQLLVFSAMAATGAATGSVRDFTLALLGVNGRKRRLSRSGVIGDLAFSIGAAAAVVAGLYKLNFGAVRFYAVAGFGLGLWGYGVVVGRYVQAGGDRVRRLPSGLRSIFRRQS